MPPTTWEHALWALCDVRDSCHSPGHLTVQDIVPEAGKPSARSHHSTVYKCVKSHMQPACLWPGLRGLMGVVAFHMLSVPLHAGNRHSLDNSLGFLLFLCVVFFFLQRAMISKFLPHPSLTPSLCLKVNSLLSITSLFLSVLSENRST